MHDAAMTHIYEELTIDFAYRLNLAETFFFAASEQITACMTEAISYPKRRKAIQSMRRYALTLQLIAQDWELVWQALPMQFPPVPEEWFWQLDQSEYRLLLNFEKMRQCHDIMIKAIREPLRTRRLRDG